ncbi:MAG: hypothetical protein O7E52_09935 [Candidatus Poribacteria bacterium]|nr:hypothetical protein [Candidatus Poribacteria bacterium]
MMIQVVIQPKDKLPLVHSLLSDAIQNQLQRLNLSLERTGQILKEFETQYAMTSDEFFRLYQNGKLDDRDNFIDWAGEYQIFQSLQDQVRCLEEIEFVGR